MFLVLGRFEPVTVAMKRRFEQSVLPDRHRGQAALL
jgi:hypothetical protein